MKLTKFGLMNFLIKNLVNYKDSVKELSTGGGINISSNSIKLVDQLEAMEKSRSDLSVVFAEIFKDEIDANEEHKLYNGIKRVIRKYDGRREAISAINEFARVITGGASLEELLQITMDELRSPSASEDTASDNCCGPEKH